MSASSAQEIADYFGATSVSDELTESEREPSYNVAPTAKVPAVYAKDDERHLDLLKWGLIPSWAKSPSIGNRMINARIETVATKNAYRAAIKRRRCIVPADAFYEWTAVEHPDRKKPVKQPWCIRRVDGAPFAFAGLYEVWRDPERDDEKVFSCTILTGPANEAMQRIHDRMPVMLAPSRWDEWLDPSNEDPTAVLAGIEPPPSELLDIYAVSTAVNNSRSRGAQLLDEVEPLTTEALAAEGKLL